MSGPWDIETALLVLCFIAVWLYALEIIIAARKKGR